MNLGKRLEQSLRAGFEFSLGELIWYALLAAGMWLVLFVLLRKVLRHRRISNREPSVKQMTREFLHSLRSIAIYGLVTAVVVYAEYLGWTRLYTRVGDYGWPWFFLSIGLMVVMHDAYFYWTHRLLHHRWLYRAVHHTHHLSTSTTPWAAYAFSPVEALVQAGIGPLIVFTIPSHPAAFGLFMTWQIAFNVLGHCGHEMYPKWFMRSRLGVLLNTVTHHAQHHEKFRSNYGLYFNLWDRLMGTNHPLYEERFESAAGCSANCSSKLDQVSVPLPAGLLPTPTE